MRKRLRLHRMLNSYKNNKIIKRRKVMLLLPTSRASLIADLIKKIRNKNENSLSVTDTNV